MSNYAIWGLFGPATWPAWLAFLALVAAYLPERRRRWSRRLLTASVGIFILFAVLPLGDWLARPLEQRYPAVESFAAPPAHIVVLAGSEDLGGSVLAGRPEITGAGDRLVQGAVLARSHTDARLWIVGGVRRFERADVEVARAIWLDLGVPDSQIGIIDGTLDTCANARGVADRRLKGAMTLVTSALHMPRAVACFEAYGLEPVPYPVDYIIRAPGPSGALTLLGNLRRTDDALHEWIGLAVYRLRGRTRTIFP